MSHSRQTAPVVLVVEDEPLLRMAAVDMFETAGFATIAAVDTDNAIALLDTRDDIMLIFTDIEMPPGRDGLSLAAHVRTTRPSIGILLTSGRTLESSLVQPAAGRFFSKPYREFEVIAEARRLVPGMPGSVH